MYCPQVRHCGSQRKVFTISRISFVLTSVNSLHTLIEMAFCYFCNWSTFDIFREQTTLGETEATCMLSFLSHSAGIFSCTSKTIQNTRFHCLKFPIFDYLSWISRVELISLMGNWTFQLAYSNVRRVCSWQVVINQGHKNQCRACQVAIDPQENPSERMSDTPYPRSPWGNGA